MCILEYQGILPPVHRRSQGTSGFVHVPVLIATTLIVPVAYLLWPALSATIRTISMVSRILSFMVPMAIWSMVAGAVAYSLWCVRQLKWFTDDATFERKVGTRSLDMSRTSMDKKR